MAETVATWLLLVLVGVALGIRWKERVDRKAAEARRRKGGPR